MSKQNLNTDSLTSSAAQAAHVLKPYRFLLFICFVSIVYGVVIVQIINLVNAEPSEAAISQQVQTTKLPRIDPKIVQQLQSLEDNSVSVKALFNEARSNPFQ